MEKKGKDQFESFGPHSPRGVMHIPLSGNPDFGLPAADDYTYTKESSRGLENLQSLQVLHHPSLNQYDYGEDQYGTKYEEMPSQHLKQMVNHLKAEKSLGVSLSARQTARLDIAQPMAEGGQQKLFGLAHYPGKSVVNILEGTKEARAMTPTMLGIAQNRTRREWGRDLSASTDLSAHSTRLVGRLQERGVLGGDEPQATNSMSFRGPWQHYPERGEVKLSHQEVMAGRATGRAALRQPKPPPEPIKYEQGTLF